jgi:hypothetical protein
MQLPPRQGNDAYIVPQALTNPERKKGRIELAQRQVTLTADDQKVTIHTNIPRSIFRSNQPVFRIPAATPAMVTIIA